MTARASRTKDKKKDGDRDTERKAAQSGRGKSRPKEELRKESGNQFANGLNELRLVQSISEKDADELSDTGQEQISLNGSGTVRFTGIKREGILEDVNGSLNGDSVPVEVVPMVGVSGDAGIEAKVLVGIGVDTLAVRGIGTRVLADTNSGRTLGNGSGANPLETGRTVFTARLAEESKGLAGNGTNRSARGVKVGG